MNSWHCVISPHPHHISVSSRPTTDRTTSTREAEISANALCGIKYRFGCVGAMQCAVQSLSVGGDRTRRHTRRRFAKLKTFVRLVGVTPTQPENKNKPCKRMRQRRMIFFTCSESLSTPFVATEGCRDCLPGCRTGLKTSTSNSSFFIVYLCMWQRGSGANYWETKRISVFFDWVGIGF